MTGGCWGLRAVILLTLDRRPGQWVGRSPYLQPVHVPETAGTVGEIVDVRIDAAEGNSLFGDTPRSAAA